MKTSESGLQFIMEQEGCVLHTYQDQAGYDTIGVGHLIKPGEDIPDHISKEDALLLLAQDVQKVEDVVNDLGWVLTQSQFDALVDFGFNCGTGALKQLAKHGMDDVPNQLPRWNKAGGRILPVLTQRRALEVEMWNA
jgi:lysozyme